MKFYFTAIILLVVSVCFGQNVKGYYVTANGIRTEGYYKPANFFNENNLYFSTSDSGTEYKKIDPALITEYGAGNDGVFKKYTVNLDDSKLMGTDVGNKKMPVWVSRTVFLNVVVSGEASLYSYLSDKGTKFFYEVADKNTGVNQLVYKQYMVNQSNIGENNQFRQQLFNDVNCDGNGVSKFANLKYNQSDLEKIFTRYNTCKGGKEGTTELKVSASQRAKFVFTVLAGVVNENITTTNPRYPGAKDNKVVFTGGLESSFTLPSEKLSFFFKLLYQDMSSTSTVNYASTSRASTEIYAINASLVNAYLGPRYNFHIGKQHTVYANAAFRLFLPFGTSSHKHITTNDLGTVSYSDKVSLKEQYLYSLGVGYMFGGKYGIEVNYDAPTKLKGADLSTIKLNTVAVNLRYKLF